MSIKVRCKNCRKKISMDEAFAGGVCRCPYCGALNMAGGSAATGGSSVRSDRPDRPDSPGAAAAAEVPAEAEEDVPVARPVRIQGIVALVLMALLLMMIVAAIVGGVMYWNETQPNGIPPNGGGGDGGDPPPVVELPITSPLVFVVDASSATDQFFDSGAALARYMILDLDADVQCQFLIVRESGVSQAANAWLPGGSDGDAKVKAFLADKVAGGATDLSAGIDEAIALKPKTIVLLASKAPHRDSERVEALAARASGAGVTVHCISLGSFDDVTESMEILSAKTGGQYRAYGEGVLDELFRNAGELP